MTTTAEFDASSLLCGDTPRGPTHSTTRRFSDVHSRSPVPSCR